MNGTTLKHISDNLPSEYDSLSEYMRAAAMHFLSCSQMPNSGLSFSDDVLVMLKEMKAEIEKNRAILLILQHYLTSKNQTETSKLKEEMVRDLIEWYVQNKNRFRTHEDLFEVDDPFLREVIPDAIQELRRKGLIKFRSNGRVVWND